MGIFQVLVHPGFRIIRQSRIFHFTRSQEYLGIFAVYKITVHIHVVKLIIVSDPLQGIVHILGWLLIIDGDIADGRFIFLNILGGNALGR
ncbi:hypothetical protein SDC9_210167 [bioreactor metagenome]|uniref:Uncharacterized protein n=1 Tax=bioreactor metagenome TaxID=1076179 RepID=A0A645JI97_9ZZZZ